jgi:hypothetical protein
MRRRTQALVLVSVSIALFFVVAPVIHTSRLAYVVYTSEGCDVVCGGYNVNQVCYDTLMYHFFGVGGAVCYYEHGMSFFS